MFHDAHADRQAEAGAAGLGRVEGHKQVGHRLGGETGAVVADVERHCITAEQAAARLRCYRLAYGGRAMGSNDEAQLRTVAADLLKATRILLDWPQPQAARALPPAVRTHARASIREGLLAMATVWEQTLRGIEVRARYLRRDLERGRPAPERKARRPRKRR